MPEEEPMIVEPLTGGWEDEVVGVYAKGHHNRSKFKGHPESRTWGINENDIDKSTYFKLKVIHGYLEERSTTEQCEGCEGDGKWHETYPDDTGQDLCADCEGEGTVNNNPDFDYVLYATTKDDPDGHPYTWMLFDPVDTMFDIPIPVSVGAAK